MEPKEQADTVGDLDERRCEALLEMGVPFDDAERYLLPDESERFRQTLAPAADAYLAGGDHRLDPRMIMYHAWLHTIDRRKQAPAKRRQAKADYDQFILEINHEIWLFKQQLESEKRPDFAYPPMLARYRPDSWCSLKLPTPEEVEKWATPHIEKKVPPHLADFVSWKVQSEVLTLPRATYELRGIPSLVWEFTIRVLATVQMELISATITRSFRGYDCQIAFESQELGHCYLAPVSWDRQVGFVTPVALLAVLAKGEVEGEGIQLTKQDRSSLSFLIHGYDGQVIISTRFRQFIIDVCKDKTLAEGLLAAGVIDKLTAEIIQKKVSALSPPATAGVPADKASDDNSEVIAALEGMGYKETEAREMIENAHLPTAMSVEEKIKEVLKRAQA